MDINTNIGINTETTTTIVDSAFNLSNTSGKFLIIGILVMIVALLVGLAFVIKNVKKKGSKQASHKDIPLSKKDAHEIIDLLKALDELNRSN